ncbi:hypothetical protein Nepgr_005219 [Nepenthes gracilis]|uniref:Uncharacterized protein n=1 Tax=Nepenthes gracilis TaxID=150966 RepID=A0AAD3S2U9_NEPGR|nr:hypothetical protein Nepgr_005219 [Nepenthes gracilis]
MAQSTPIDRLKWALLLQPRRIAALSAEGRKATMSRFSSHRLAKIKCWPDKMQSSQEETAQSNMHWPAKMGAVTGYSHEAVGCFSRMGK